MKYTHIHFVGIKGVGMMPLALIAKEAGITVTGSDLGEVFITDQPLTAAGIVPFIGFDPSHIAGADLVITTGAHGGLDNAEVVAAQQKGIPILLQGKAVGEYMTGKLFDRIFKGISITGTHGKTTTTAMLATILQEAELDPSYVIGTSDIPSLKSAGHYGKGEYFVAEADEYATDPKYDNTPKFLWQNPQILLINNIEHDHPDIYPTLADVIEAFRRLIEHLPEEGIIVGNGDDSAVIALLSHVTKKYLTVGFGSENTYQIAIRSHKDERTQFSVSKIGELELSVFGEHNVMNAAMAAVVAHEVGVDTKVLRTGLQAFRGSKRRMEYIGRLSTGAFVYDDYAHNPTKIKKTLQAFREAFPTKKIICVFQPHTYSRTKTLFDEFIHSFSDADMAIIAPIYASMREEPDESVTSEKLVAAMQSLPKHALFVGGFTAIIKHLNTLHLSDDSILITMGAGDVYKVLDGLPLQKEQN